MYGVMDGGESQPFEEAGSATSDWEEGMEGLIRRVEMGSQAVIGGGGGAAADWEGGIQQLMGRRGVRWLFRGACSGNGGGGGRCSEPLGGAAAAIIGELGSAVFVCEEGNVAGN